MRTLRLAIRRTGYQLPDKVQKAKWLKSIKAHDQASRRQWLMPRLLIVGQVPGAASL
jgi:hypothetical protein